MSTLAEMLRDTTALEASESEWLHLLAGDWQLIADLSFAHTVRDLSAPPVPLIEIRGRLEGRGALTGAVELTPTGREVLAGRADRVEECGLERWLGGVHLAAPGPLWRWDRAHERFVHS